MLARTFPRASAVSRSFGVRDRLLWARLVFTQVGVTVRVDGWPENLERAADLLWEMGLDVRWDRDRLETMNGEEFYVPFLIVEQGWRSPQLARGMVRAAAGRWVRDR